MPDSVILMVAPNGARKTRSDHRNLPVSIADTVDEAAACYAAGACAIHAHVRGDHDEHVLDAGRYRELIAELGHRVPGMLVQITSEAVGIYTPEQQVACIQAVKPAMASMCLREISADFTRPEYARDFFAWCDDNRVHVQHIVFSADEFRHFLDYRERGLVPAAHRCVLFVLGRYNVDFQSDPAELEPFLRHGVDGLDWFICAFGKREQACVLAAIAAGGNARIGFENNLYLPDGSIAENTAALVRSLAARLESDGLALATAAEASQRLGIRSA